MKKWKIVIVIAFSLLLAYMGSIHTEAASKKDTIQSWNRGRVVIDDISVYYK